MEVSPSADTLVALGDSVRLVGEARDANGHLIEDATFNWSSTDASVASVDISGLVTAARNGRAAVIARAGAVSANVEILVAQEVAEVGVSPSSDTLVAFGDTVRLTAEVTDANGHGIETATFSWRSSNPRVVMVNTSGLVTAAGNGRATVTASAGAESGAAVITAAQEVAEVRVSPSADTLVALEDTVRLVAEARDATRMWWQKRHSRTAVTLASFRDLAYEQVDLSLADKFELPMSSPDSPWTLPTRLE